MICAYLLHSHEFATAAQALKFYGEARTSNGKVGLHPSSASPFPRLLFSPLHFHLHSIFFLLFHFHLYLSSLSAFSSSFYLLIPFSVRPRSRSPSTTFHHFSPLFTVPPFPLCHFISHNIAPLVPAKLFAEADARRSHPCAGRDHPVADTLRRVLREVPARRQAVRQTAQAVREEDHPAALLPRPCRRYARRPVPHRVPAEFTFTIHFYDKLVYTYSPAQGGKPVSEKHSEQEIHKMEIQSMLQSSSKLNVSLSVPGLPRQDRFGAWGSLPVSCAVPRVSHRQSKHFLRAFAFLPLDTLFCPHCFALPLTLLYCIHAVLPLLFADIVLIVLLDFGDVYFCPLTLLLL